ncbi:hypothetical protein COU77_02220 [Candidatus Peregrinibacteria bacterium CG10_big_fil_rev_8_21_14_0_10_49_16]|nr:MAG: hypothetical protein COW95_00730 [Candidatus Peregrinibacteria bacterium CG22_combo_CG10-13_8_21_14_all_49_11]PIR52094.1 MAG: hypothetical protein COU77_02220 [Candidatus Peregrinibacteria bacterium CG10_big_fil_rev_8_21_14_0_10_49_16]
MLQTSAPFTFILFGASGHLARIKIFPALYILALKKRLPNDFAIVGFARTAMDDMSFRGIVRKAVEEDIPHVNTDILNTLLEHMFYHQGQYTKQSDFVTLSTRLNDLERHWEDPVRVAYLSIPPNVFPVVLENICKGHVHEHKRKNDFRCIVEKPVGHDLGSANAVIDNLLKCFQEHEIHLLDHYLGKEAVRNVYYLRYANPILERLFKNTLIHHVEITASEPKGIEGRAGYFDAVGTFLDMFQSHLLMIASLLTMRLEEEDDFRASRKNALEQFYLPPASSLDDVVLQGQYAAGDDAKGYLDEDNVQQNSRANTYAALKLLTRTSRWQGVPFYLRSGKRLERKETRISIQFQEPHSVGKDSRPNRLDIILQGEAGMRMYLQTKLGGTEPKFRPLLLEDPLVCVGDCLPEHGLLLLEAIHGKQQWFLSFEEVRTAWRLVDPIQTHLQDTATPLYQYAAGSKGPAEADAWIERDGIHWCT